ncbi:hypothetical protein [Agromyces mangrovi Wang et al. 2018]|uniref:hypothetical protein n=1 Tax=Agromyces mangrovi TaxID=1858653 RepID=UPI002572B410|nr:hypothetical protein [Agromyces mangrovi]BDZ65048.1 hypothetical protein GCM10025877_19860 [Agromyces mangrovi]
MPRLPFAIVVVALAAMVIVPGIASLSPTPTFFGWHMYSGYRAPLTFEVTHEDGTRVDVPLNDIAAGLRVEVAYARVGAAFLCERDQSATTVRAVRVDGSVDVEYSCSDF